MDKFWQDLRYGARMLARKPGFTAVIVTALALGIGPNTAIFSVVNAVLLMPLPYDDPATLVTTAQAPPGPSGAERGMLVSTEDFQDWRSVTKTFERMALHAPETATLTGGEEPVRLNGSRVSPDLFPLLRVQPAAGRLFSHDEEKPGAGRSVILSHAAWEKWFGTDRAVVGSPIRLDGNDVTVVGIMPPGFAFPNRETEYWVPFTLEPPQRSVNERRVMVVPFVARLKPGVSIREAEAEGTALIQRLRRRDPDAGRQPEGGSLHLVTLQERSAGRFRPALLILLAAVGFVLLIACANVANLLLARAADREREVSIRIALGAGRLRLLRQMLTESLLLSVLGGAAGLLLGYFAVSALPRLAPADFPLTDIRMNAQVLVFAAALTLVSGLLFGCAPAVEMLRGNLVQSLKEGGQQTTAGLRLFRGNTVRSLLAISEVALAVMLLIGAVLLSASFLRLSSQSPGYEARGALVAQISLPRARYPQPQQHVAFYDDFLDRVRRIPGVQSAGLTNLMPLTPAMMRLSFNIPGQAASAAGFGEPVAGVRLVSPGFFRAMATPMLDGREFSSRDGERGEPVVIVNQSFARKFFPGERAVGRQLDVEMLRQIVGIVGDIKPQGLDSDPQPEIYLPYAQMPRMLMMGGPAAAMTVVMRSAGDPLAAAPEVRAALKLLDPQLPLFNITTLERRVSDSVAQPRFYAFLLGLFALLAVVLAALGIYGVISYRVAQCTRELGLRIALGAGRAKLMGMVLRQGALLAAAGIALGLGGAWATSRFLAGLLYGITATDALTYGATAAAMALVGMAGTCIPSSRAMSVDPIEALRYE